MLFPEEDALLLKKWIVKRLENTSDADADVLADYVLALLRHDGDTETVRALCMAEIPDFLQEDSAVFIRDVFDVIAYKSYLPGSAPPPQRRPSLPFAPPTGPSAAMPSYGPGPALGMGGQPFGGPNGSRKRTYNDRGDGDPQDRGMMPMGGPDSRMLKQPRRGGGVPGRGGGYDNFNGRGGFPGGRQSPMLHHGPPIMPMPGMPSPPLGMPTFDPADPMAFMLQMQNMGQNMGWDPNLNAPPISPSGRGPPPVAVQTRRPRCRDYDQKGFCARGNTCMYEHGDNSIFVPPGKKSDEYDPTNAGIMTGIERNGNPNGSPHAPGPGPGFNNFNNTRGNDRGRGRGGPSRGDRGGNASRRGGRAEFSSDRPNFDRSKTTIVVENIPEDKFSEDAVREFFSQFGSIKEIGMRPYKRLSIVKFDDWNGASGAYNSPKVIFDNRFVKVYWYTNDSSLPQPPATAANGSAVNNGNLESSPTKEAEPQIDLEEFARKQEEAQKSHEEKMKKKLEMEVARKELEKRQEELAKSRAEEKRKLMEKLAAKTAKSGGTPTPTGDAKPVSQTDALKAQLAALEAEAQSLGLDPSTDEPSYGYRGRGRGRGGYRGRGAFVPRGFRGGYRGRGGAPFTGGGAYKLDNRPKKIALTGIDFTDTEKDENLRQFLLGIGEYTSLDVTPSTTSITFKDRFTAEKFMYGIPDGELPSVGKVEMAWVQTPLPPVNLNPIKSEEVKQEEDNDAMALDSSPVRGGGNQHPGHGHGGMGDDLDYDVAEDYVT